MLDKAISRGEQCSKLFCLVRKSGPTPASPISFSRWPVAFQCWAIRILFLQVWRPPDLVKAGRPPWTLQSGGSLPAGLGVGAAGAAGLATRWCRQGEAGALEAFAAQTGSILASGLWRRAARFLDCQFRAMDAYIHERQTSPRQERCMCKRMQQSGCKAMSHHPTPPLQGSGATRSSTDVLVS